MEIITRKEAVKLGLKRYFTGKPCKHGHISERAVGKSTCLECKSIWIEGNKESKAKSDRKYYLKNKDNIKLSQDSYRISNRYRFNKYSAKRRAYKLNATVPWSNEESIEIRYRYRDWMTEITGILHHVDHFVPLISEKVCGLHVHENLVVISATRNWIKSNKFE